MGFQPLSQAQTAEAFQHLLEHLLKDIALTDCVKPFAPEIKIAMPRHDRRAGFQAH